MNSPKCYQRRKRSSTICQTIMESESVYIYRCKFWNRKKCTKITPIAKIPLSMNFKKSFTETFCYFFSILFPLFLPILYLFCMYDARVMFHISRCMWIEYCRATIYTCEIAYLSMELKEIFILFLLQTDNWKNVNPLWVCWLNDLEKIFFFWKFKCLMFPSTK